MVLTSISTISSSSSFLSDSPSTSTLFRNRAFPSFLVGFPISPFSNATLRIKPCSCSSASSTKQDIGSPEQFLKKNANANFLRFKKGIDGATGVLQTSIARYKSLLNPFLQVDLVSTAHLADKEYYQALQKELESYDCVLYEMVVIRETRGFNIHEFLPRVMAPILKLDLQSDYLNYESENWQRADLDYETLQLLQDEKGENFSSFIEEMTLSADEISQSSILENLQFRVLSRLGFSGAIKLFSAEFLTSALAEVASDVEGKSVIVGERNRVAIEALRTAMDKGNNRIAILYGSAHMPDLGRRLKEEFDLFPSGVEWITAWSISKRKHAPSGLLLELLVVLSVLGFNLWFLKLFIGTALFWFFTVASKVFGYGL